MSDMREKLACDIRAALGPLNNNAEPVVTLVRDIRQRLAEIEARVAQLAAKAHNLSFGIVSSLTDEQQEPFAKQFAELQDCIASQSSGPYVLRKQAEAVEILRASIEKQYPLEPFGDLDEYVIAGMKEIYMFVEKEAQHLRQQAEDAERAGGEK